MSLEIKELTKVYGTQKAVDGISFSVTEGEIVGFLGPNGAGKSTTMKIATGYLSATTGAVFVDGMDVAARPMAVKKIIGYLPEHNPLYPDMFVHEYLTFTGSLYGLSGKKLRNRVGQMVEQCGLTLEQNKKIEALSKGYRQRVGLAQALLHDPKVLILDEPTSGLDPNQLVEIRKLIKEVSRNKTVLFSTHIMQEVQALCERVVVINRGLIVADDRVANLVGRNLQVIIVEFGESVALDELRAIPGVEEVELCGHCLYRIRQRANVEVRSEIFRFAASKNISLMGLRQEENSLENVFTELTRAAGNT
jgi:ABC-2 type transport system ATP-binding protein